jgi:hypothetical protein
MFSYSIYPDDDSQVSKHVALLNTKTVVELRDLVYKYIIRKHKRIYAWKQNKLTAAFDFYCLFSVPRARSGGIKPLVIFYFLDLISIDAQKCETCQFASWLQIMQNDLYWTSKWRIVTVFKLKVTLPNQHFLPLLLWSQTDSTVYSTKYRRYPQLCLCSERSGAWWCMNMEHRWKPEVQFSTRPFSFFCHWYKYDIFNSVMSPSNNV